MTRMHRKKVALHAALLTSISLAAALAVSQSPAWADAPKADTGGSLEEIVVTANRRNENLQVVPIAIEAVSADSATQMGITDASSLAAAVPGLEFNRQSNASIPFLRGVGNPTGESGDEPSVAMYVDDVYMPAGSASLSNFSSIENIEVEKGPQGTLFGRNATGGVIQVHTRDPSSKPVFEASVGYGNYDTSSASLYASGALTSTLSANISVYQSSQNKGWGKNLTTGNDAYTGWDNGGRIKLLWEPGEKFSALLTADVDRTRTDQGVVYNPWPGTLALPGFPGAKGFYDYVGDVDAYSLNKQYGFSLKMTGDVGWAKLVSISAWRNNNAVDLFPYDPVPLPLANTLITTPERTVTQEFRLLSPEGQKWSWIVGAFYYHDNAGFDPLLFMGPLIVVVPGLSSIPVFGLETTTSWAGFAQTTYPILPDTNVTAGIRYTRDQRELNAGYKFGPTFFASPNSPQEAAWSKPTFRLSLDHSFTPDIMAYIAFNRGFKSGLFNPVVFYTAPIDPPINPEVLDSYTVGTKSEFLEHRLRVNAEAFYYKYSDIQVDEVNGAGTHLTNAASATIKGIDLDLTAEPVQNFTVTASIEVLDGHYNDFKNGQYWIYNPAGPYYPPGLPFAGGNCAIVGGSPTVAGRCGLPVGSPYLPRGYNAATGNYNLAGNHTIQSPPFSSSLALNYLLPTSIGKVDLSVNWNHTGNYYADADNGLGQQPPSSPNNNRQAILDLFNASVAWTSNDEHWTARLWSKNLSAVKSWSFALQDGFITQYSAAPPRTFGITLGTHW